MNWYEIALGVVLVVVSLLIIVFTLAQEQKGQGLSGAIMGESSATMAAGRERGVDAKLAKLTKVCGVVFFVVTLVVCVLSARLCCSQGKQRNKMGPPSASALQAAPRRAVFCGSISEGHRRTAVRRKLKEYT